MNVNDPLDVGEDMLHWVPRGSPRCYGYFDWSGPVNLDALNQRLAPLEAVARNDGGRIRVECSSANVAVVAGECLAAGGRYGTPTSRLGDQRYW